MPRLADPDPFEHIEKQVRVHELIEMHRAELLAEARAILSEHPKAKVVGLILDPDTDAAAAFRREAAEQGIEVPPTSGFVGILPRAEALRYLRQCAPRAVEWLSDSEHSSTRMKIPVLAAASDGLQIVMVTTDLA